ncbi:MAG: hypothetical protein WC759_00290 [Candidatus Micrarchaeia archaeon]|jgi:hypothetical protein
MDLKFLVFLAVLALLAAGCANQAQQAPTQQAPGQSVPAAGIPPAPATLPQPEQASTAPEPVVPNASEPTQAPVEEKEVAPAAPETPEAVQAPPEKKTLQIEWSNDAGTRISDGSVPFALKLKDGRVRLYYCGAGGILSSISSDGLNFQKESGVRFNSNQGGTCDPSVISLPDGRFRMYYKIAFGQGGPGLAVHNVYSAISDDGLAFRDEGIRIDSQKSGDEGWASVPEAIMLEDGSIRIYYVSGDYAARGGTMSAISSDGLEFQKEEGARAEALVDPAALRMPDNSFLLFAVSLPAPPGVEQSLPQGIYMQGSEDGLQFGAPVSVLQEDGVYDPSVIETGENTFRIYYGKNIGSESLMGQNIVVKSISGKVVG